MDQISQQLGKYLPGWKAYFRLAQTPSTFRDLDSWIRRRLRAVQPKQWKRGTTIYRSLRSLGTSHDVAVQVAAAGRRWWHTSRSKLHQVLTVAYFDNLGIPRLT
jgi:RNA-directed DNA polymerase